MVASAELAGSGLVHLTPNQPISTLKPVDLHLISSDILHIVSIHEQICTRSTQIAALKG